MGTSGNVDPVVPHKTKTYREGGNAAEGGVPMCTLRNFPHLIGTASSGPATSSRSSSRSPRGACASSPRTRRPPWRTCARSSRAATLRADGAAADAEAPSLLRLALTPLANRRAACAQRAFDAFHALFRDMILDLTTAYPADARVKGADGADKGPFWSGHKKFPSPATYGAGNGDDWKFLVSATHLLAQSAAPSSPAAVTTDDHGGEAVRGLGRAPRRVLATPAYVSKKVDTTGMEQGAPKPEEAAMAGDDHARWASRPSRSSRARTRARSSTWSPRTSRRTTLRSTSSVTACANCRRNSRSPRRTRLPKLTRAASPAIATTRRR
ncbi:ubiquitin activating enzyme [Aureococcus anophagefferens]|nr:ubiquitin activating enzyme [Aureococcus anophagefferens]